MGSFGDRLRALRRQAIAAGMRLLSEEEIVGGNAPWKTCSIHGPANPNVWGCPECLRDLRQENARFKACVPQSAAALPGNLKRVRESKGLSPMQLASKAGVSTSTVRDMEVGRDYAQGGARSDPNPMLTSLLAVAQALGVGVEVLVEEHAP